MSKIRVVTIIRKCAGGCGASVEYAFEDDQAPTFPELQMPGVEYRGGNLCLECERVVEEALALRRPRAGWSWWPLG